MTGTDYLYLTEGDLCILTENINTPSGLTLYKGLNEFIKNLNNSEYDNFYIISNLHNKLKANINC